MEREQFDTDLFINEIEARPSIWDMKSPEYKDRVKKKKHWEEIVDIFCPSGEVKDKQHVGKLKPKNTLYILFISYNSFFRYVGYNINTVVNKL